MSQTDTSTPQEMMKVKPQDEHRWLQKLVGEWTYESGDSAGQGEKMIGTETVRSVGDIWIQAEGRGTMPDGSPGISLMTLGYDPARGRFVGTWLGSMMTHLWIYDGELDAARQVLTLNSEGPSLSGDGTMGKYQDVMELKTPDHRILRGRTLGADGKWQEFMTTHYRRKR